MKPLFSKAYSCAFGLSVLLGSTAVLWGQSAPDQGPPPAVTGPDFQGPSIENPPLSGLDQPSFEPGYGARSYLQPKLQVSEAADSNPGVQLGSSNAVRSVTRALGGVDLQKLWKVHPFDLSYAGGIAHYYQSNTYQVHSLVATQRFLWRTGRLALRDSFDYLPEGSFGFNSFGGAGGFSGGGGLGNLGGPTGGELGGSGGGVAENGSGGVFAGSQLGSLGNQRRYTNFGIVDVTQDLTPRAALVLSGGYGLVNFVDNPPGYINSQLAVGQAGYNYQISRRDQIGLNYAFQEFHFPRLGSGTFNVNSGRALYGHRITGKLDFRVGGGPQWVHVHGYTPVPPNLFVPDFRSYVSFSGNLWLNYRLSERTHISLQYLHYINPGSGFFAGANSDRVNSAMAHSLSRKWTVIGNGGYSHNSRILSTAANPLINQSRTYEYWYGGAALRRQLGVHFGAFASYQYDRLGFGSGICAASNPRCASHANRNVGLIGLDWIPRPFRLD